MTRKRSESGQYVGTVTRERILDIFDTIGWPVITTSDVREHLDCTTEAARRRLNDLCESGELQKRSSGRTTLYLQPNYGEPTPEADGRGLQHDEPDSEPPSQPDVVPDDRRQQDDVDHQREQMEAVLEELHVPGRDPAVERTRREATKYAWERLREYEEINAQRLANDTFGQFFDKQYLNYSTSPVYPGYGLWDNCLRDVLSELPGVVKPRERGKTYRFDPDAFE